MTAQEDRPIPQEVPRVGVEVPHADRTDRNWCENGRRLGRLQKIEKNTSGGNICIGGHCIKVWAKTQAVIAKSSAESELYGVVRGACEALGMKSSCADLGSDVGVRLELDATAAKGILDRQGLAKVRHIERDAVNKPPNCIRYQRLPQLRASRQMPGEISQGEISGPSEENMDVG